jgi:hypothetical protein
VHCTVVSNGTAAVVLSGAELVARLAALVPPPGMHRVRHFGVFAPRARLRDDVVPAKTVTQHAAGAAGCVHTAGTDLVPAAEDNTKSRRRRMTWARALERVFGIDVSVCPRCGQKGMRQVAVITEPRVIHAMLAAMEHNAKPP